MKNYRQLRFAEQIRFFLTKIFEHGSIQNNLIKKSIFSISEVKISRDLKIARCFVASFDQNKNQSIVDILNLNKKYIRGKIGYKIRYMKYVPEFYFECDLSFRKFSKIEKLLSSPEVIRDLDIKKNLI